MLQPEPGDYPYKIQIQIDILLGMNTLYLLFGGVEDVAGEYDGARVLLDDGSTRTGGRRRNPPLVAVAEAAPARNLVPSSSW